MPSLLDNDTKWSSLIQVSTGSEADTALAVLPTHLSRVCNWKCTANATSSGVASNLLSKYGSLHFHPNAKSDLSRVESLNAD